MRQWKLRFVMLIVATALLLPGAAFAAKKYQITGKVLGFDDKLITIENKDGEKWEIDRTADTKVTGTLKIGEKVTIQYKMAATDVEVKK